MMRRRTGSPLPTIVDPVLQRASQVGEDIVNGVYYKLFASNSYAAITDYKHFSWNDDKVSITEFLKSCHLKKNFM